MFRHRSPRPIKPLSDRFILAVAFSVGAFICVVSATTNALLLIIRHPAAMLLVQCDAAAGIASILLTWKLLRWSRERNELLRQRDRMILALNHEVRNAIQVISLADYHERGTEESEVKLSISRIERALDEYVPNNHVAKLVRERRQESSA
ncbi:MAG: hypothetical protein ACXVZR_14130 [Terriglobales bacterium]